MDIKDGFTIYNNQIIKWNFCFEELKEFCEKNNIDYKSELTDKVMKISCPIEFANLGETIGTFYFSNNIINIVYITSENCFDFNIERYLLVNEKLTNYFGKPQQNKKSKTSWKYDSVEVKHFYINKDGEMMEYLTVENASKYQNH